MSEPRIVTFTNKQARLVVSLMADTCYIIFSDGSMSKSFDSKEGGMDALDTAQEKKKINAEEALSLFMQIMESDLLEDDSPQTSPFESNFMGCIPLQEGKTLH